MLLSRGCLIISRPSQFSFCTNFLRVCVCVPALVYRTFYATELRCCALAVVALNGPRYNNLGASLLSIRLRLVGHRRV